MARRRKYGKKHTIPPINASRIVAVIMAPKALYPIALYNVPKYSNEVMAGLSLDLKRTIGTAEFTIETNPEDCIRQHMPGLDNGEDIGTGLGPGLYMGAAVFAALVRDRECTYSPLNPDTGPRDAYADRTSEAHQAWDNLIRHDVAVRRPAGTGEGDLTVTARGDAPIFRPFVREYIQEKYDQYGGSWNRGIDLRPFDWDDDGPKHPVTGEVMRDGSFDITIPGEEVWTDEMMTEARASAGIPLDGVARPFIYGVVRAMGTVQDGAVSVVGAGGSDNLTFNEIATVTLHYDTALLYDFMFAETIFKGGSVLWVQEPQSYAGGEFVRYLLTHFHPPPGPAFAALDFTDATEEWVKKITRFCAEGSTDAGDGLAASFISIIDALYENPTVPPRLFESVRRYLVDSAPEAARALVGRKARDVELALLIESGAAEAGEMGAARNNPLKPPTVAQKRRLERQLKDQDTLFQEWANQWERDW